MNLSPLQPDSAAASPTPATESDAQRAAADPPDPADRAADTGRRSSCEKVPDGRDPIAFIRDAAPPVPPMRPELQILQSLRRIIRAAEIFSKQLIRQHKITGPQLMCLRKLMESEGLTVSELSRAIYLSPSTVVGILDRLEERDLIARRRSEDDRRKVLIHPTEAGRELVAEAPSPLQVALERGLRSLEPQEQQRMAESFAQLVHMLELDFVDAAPVLETGPLDSACPEEESGGV